MPIWSKLLIGLAAVLILGWVQEGLLGNGERFIGSLETRARAVVAETNLTSIEVQLSRHPLERIATLSGPANDFQRNGMGSFKGLTERVGGISGIGQVRWADEPRPSGIVLPLIAEILLLMCAGYLLGLGLAWLFLRPRREGRYA